MQPTLAVALHSRVARMLFVLSLLLCGSRLSAQTDDIEPYLTITPASGTYTSPTISVTITWYDEKSLNMGSKRIVFNNVDVTGSFTHSASTPNPRGGVMATSSGTVTMVPGSGNLLTASILDGAGNPSWPSEAAYTYKAGRADVAVRPDGGHHLLASGGTRSLTFEVVNTGTAAGTFLLRPSCRDAWSGAAIGGCTTASPSVDIAAGGIAQVVVSFPGGAVDGSTLVQLAAERADAPGTIDAGWLDATFTGAAGAAQVPLSMRVVDLNSGINIDRGQCVTVAVAPGAAMECGDLRLAHGLPALQALGRTRAPALLYNSAHTAPIARFYVDATLPAGSAVPTSVKMYVVRSNGSRDSTAWQGSRWAPGVTIRVATSTTWNDPATGIYPYTLELVASYADGTQRTSSVSGEVVIVNRANSEFGPGWWLAGLERLHFVSNGRILWVGGDGSTRVYSPAGPGKWSAENVDQPDTLYASSYPGDARYERRLSGGGLVTFYGHGLHAATVDRLDRHTHFGYDNHGRLGWVAVPWQRRYDGGKSKYRFHQNANAKIETITSPDLNDNPVRTITIGRNASHQVVSITDPDNVPIGFTYNGRLVASRTDRRGTQTRFTYGDGATLVKTRLDLSAADSIVARFEPVEGKGFNAPPPLANAYTRLVGARSEVNDNTLIWPGRWGAPRRIRDASGRETLLVRGNAAYPAVVTEVRGSDASGALVVKSSATHDGRGRVRTSTVHNALGDGQSVTTTLGYDDRWDAVTSISTPGAPTVTREYDPQNGNRLWEQAGPDPARRVNYAYHQGSHLWHGEGGQLSAIHYPLNAQGQPSSETFGYDWWGNLVHTRSALGFYTRFYRDELGRSALVIMPIDAASSTTLDGVEATGLRQRTFYGVMGLVDSTYTAGPAVSFSRGAIASVHGAGVDTAWVRNVYDRGGNLLQVDRWARPDRANVDIITNLYEYDAAGRMTAKAENMRERETFEYDAGGNVVAWTTKRGNRIVTSYDALGRRTRSITPAVAYGATSVNCADRDWYNCRFDFPKYSNNGTGGYTVPGDTSHFEYDLLGNLRRAENADAIVTRTYLPGGALSTDTLRIRAYGAGDFESHVYGIAYAYDANGRLRALQHPANLAGAGARDSMAYNQMGELASVTSRTGHTFGFGYDLLGRLISDTYPGGGNSYVYDLDGRKTQRSGAYSESFAYDARGKILQANNGQSTFRQHYTGIGMLAATDWGNTFNHAVNVEEMTVDALGHVSWKRTGNDQNGGNHPQHRYRYDMGTSRVDRIEWIIPHDAIDYRALSPDTTFRAYDGSGNVRSGWRNSWVSNQGSGYSKSYTQSYYGADERLRAQQAYDEQGSIFFTGERRGYFSEYRYDALGRRVLVRTRRDGLCRTNNTSTVDCTGGIERFVWAGDNILWEMRGPGADSVSAQRLEQVSGPGVEFGIVGYTHAGGVDRPLIAWKGGDIVVPHMNWRGLFGRGTNLAGTAAHEIEWPGERMTATYINGPTQAQTRLWFGGVLEGQRDAGGAMYMRNRYYDPATGQFTQTDPIGIAGGLNTYGFAAGDPVSYSDPYGLCPNGPQPCDEVDIQTDAAMVRRVWDALPTVWRVLTDPCGPLPDCRHGTADFGLVGGIGPLRAAASGTARIASRIGDVPALARIASRLAGGAQDEVNVVVSRLAQGNMNPGIGNRHLFNGIFEARTRNGARVYFRNTGDGVEILAKSTKNKAEQARTISVLQDVYGN